MEPSDVLRLMPSVFQRAATPGSPTELLVQEIATAFTPIERHLERFPKSLRSDTASAEFVYALARMVDLDRFFVESVAGAAGDAHKSPEFAAGVERLRRLIEAAPQLSRLRGTGEGLDLFLEAATGVEGFEIEEATDRPFHMHVTAPASTQGLERLIRRIIAAEKPAYVTFTLDFDDAARAEPQAEPGADGSSKPRNARRKQK